MTVEITGTLHGEKPHPRLLIAAELVPDKLEQDPRARALAEALRDLFPTIQIVTPQEVSNEIRESEFDVVVDFDAGLRWTQRPLHRIVVGGRGDVASTTIGERLLAFRRSSRSKAREFIIPDGLPQELQRLAQDDLCRNALKSDDNRILQGRFPGQSESADRTSLKPLLLDADHQVLAGWFSGSGNVETWMLPADADITSWIQVLVKRWTQMFPEQFPTRSDWHTEVRWQSPLERKLHAELREIEDQRIRLLGELQQREQKAVEALAKAKQSADIHERLLVATQGSDLERGVQQCLEALGFDAVHQDPLNEEGDKLEDLRVTAKEEPGWIALAEVKGNKGGTKLNDFQKAAIRFVKRYIQDNGEPPAAMWFIANPSIGRSPEEREAPLRSNPDDVKIHAEENNALVIDTADLLEAWMAVQSGTVSAADIRRSLMESTGYWTFTLDITTVETVDVAPATQTRTNHTN
jgi:hypothetical protein